MNCEVLVSTINQKNKNKIINDLRINDCVIINVAGTLPIRAPGQFNATRKIGKQHQNFLVFYKGDISSIKNKYFSL